MRKTLTAITATILTTLIFGLSTSNSSNAYAETEPAANPDITIYHLEGRRSERIVWLMEELNMPYSLIYERGDLAGSMAKIRAINPDVPMAPTVTIGDQVLVESGAIIEVILNRYAPGQLQPKLHSAEYAKHQMWMHFAEGSLAARCCFLIIVPGCGNHPRYARVLLIRKQRCNTQKIISQNTRGSAAPNFLVPTL